jgi:competence ComEA-like helix-hairpin-helix protein
MGDADTRALRLTALILLVVSVARVGWNSSRPHPPVVGTSEPDSLLPASRGALSDASARKAPLASGQTLDPNRASARDLDRLPGVGAGTASRIVEERTRSGPFASVEELLRVRGVGPALIERIRPHVSIAQVPQGGRAGRRRAAERRGSVRIDVNRADAESLQALPGIGPALAARIVEERRSRPFASVSDLTRVRGIGAATVRRLQGLVKAGGTR